MCLKLLFAVNIAIFVISKDQVNTDRGEGHKITRVRTQIIHYIFQVIMTILSLNKLGLHHHVVNRPFKVLIGDTKAICTEGIG